MRVHALKGNLLNVSHQQFSPGFASWENNGRPHLRRRPRLLELIFPLTMLCKLHTYHNLINVCICICNTNTDENTYKIRIEIKMHIQMTATTVGANLSFDQALQVSH